MWDGGEDDEHDGVGFVEISLYHFEARRFYFGAIPFERLNRYILPAKWKQQNNAYIKHILGAGCHTIHIW